MRPRSWFYVVAALMPLAVAPAGSAQTAAWWRFEGGKPGEPVSPVEVIEDSSGCGNDLRTASVDTAPRFVADVPFAAVPLTGRANRVALDNTERPARRMPTRDLYVVHRADSEATFDLNRDPLPQWTVEASVLVRADDGWERRFETFVGRDGYDIPKRDPVEEDPLSAFGFKKRGDDNHFSVEAWDSAGNHVTVRSLAPAKPDVWYQLAAVSDGENLTLFLKGPSDAAFVRQNSAPFHDRLAIGSGPWSVGRGFFANLPAEQFFGLIDEVRISAAALKPTQFLASSAPPSAEVVPPLAATRPTTRPAASVARTFPPAPSDLIGVHDPTLFLQGNTFHVFSSHNGIGHWRSTDLIHWEKQPSIFKQAPEWARRDIGERAGLWAPDVAFFNGKFHVYYSTSLFGSQRSAIGLVTNESLDPADPKYDWRDQGKVIESFPGMAFNAIDPSVLVDGAGAAWMAFGSWNKGIYLRQLDAETGKLSLANATEYHLYERPERHAVEAPSLFFHDGWYYLTASNDYCCRGVASTYKLVIGRSRNVTGPYVDRDGRAMIDGHASLLLRSYGFSRGPGQSTFIQQGDRSWIAHHYYDARDAGTPRLQVRPVFWDDAGWPLVGEPVAETDGQPRATELGGQWRLTIDYDEASETTIQLEPTGAISADSSPLGRWKREKDRVRLDWSTRDGAVKSDNCFPADNGQTFVGRRSDGSIVSGERIDTMK